MNKLDNLEAENKLKNEFRVKEAFQLSFFEYILCGLLQPLLFDETRVD